VAGSVFLADLTAIGFLLSYAFDRLGRRAGPVPRTAAILLVFLLAFLLVYLIGFFNLETGQALDQYGKGLVKWLIHFAFLIVGVIYLAGRSLRFFWRTLGWFLGGIAVNAA
jgi:predicted PurR-regulated permease PerM